MYCEDSAGTDIEHFRPKSTYPLSAFDWNNYLWACSSCNSNFKRASFPLSATGDPLLIDPSLDDPLLHIALSFSTGLFVPLTHRGQLSISVFGLQREILVKGRRDAWVVLQAMLRRYIDARETANNYRSNEAKRVILDSSFGGVLVFAMQAANMLGARDTLGEEFLGFLGQCPELGTWI